MRKLGKLDWSIKVEARLIFKKRRKLFLVPIELVKEKKFFFFFLYIYIYNLKKKKSCTRITRHQRHDCYLITSFEKFIEYRKIKKIRII